MRNNDIKKTLRKGFTLVEVVITIAILGIGMAGLSVFFFRILKSNQFILEEGVASFQASQGVQKMVNELRKVRQGENGEYPVTLLDDFELTVFSDIDGDQTVEKVHYYLDGSDLKMGVSNPSGSPLEYPDGDQTVSTIVKHVANESDEPVFYYYNRDYPDDLANNPVVTPVADRQLIRLVEVYLIINIKPQSAPDNVNIGSFAEFRNLNDYQ